jgi:Domain of unknown function (DUF397)
MARHDEVIDGWRKSSTSGDGACVEVQIATEHVSVRDTKNKHGAVLTFTYAEWKAFLEGVQRGEFELRDELFQ